MNRLQKTALAHALKEKSDATNSSPDEQGGNAKKINYPKRFLTYTLCLFLFFGCKKKSPPHEDCIIPPIVQNYDLLSFKMDGADLALDSFPRTFYYPISDYEVEFSPFVEITNEPQEILINNRVITNESNNDLGLVKVNEPLPIKLTWCDTFVEEYLLIFTRHPIIQIDTDGQTIQNDPKIPIGFKINDPDFLINGMPERELTSYAGIEFRGGSAQSYPKKAYGLELWKNSFGGEKIDAPLLGMRDDDDWILDAMYIDKGRMRHRVSMDIWLDFQEVYYLHEEPDARSGVRGKMVEVFIDDRYRGIYMLSERMDRKQLQLKEFENGADDFGVLYKSTHWGNGTVTFAGYWEEADSLNGYWDGWEHKYPDTEAEGIFWDPISDFTRFVLYSSDDEFKNQINDHLQLGNAADYYMFLNLMRADDNVGKNMFLAMYDTSEVFFIAPWDLDGTWGRFWDGSATSPNVILTNGLFNRLIETNAGNFKNLLKQRWLSARSGIFSKNSLMSYFEYYAELMTLNGSFEREFTKWNMVVPLEDEMEHISTWLDDRLAYLDDYFDTL
ncbi:MAG: CotH kinase family protein [Bacteroidota bacterium]